MWRGRYKNGGCGDDKIERQKTETESINDHRRKPPVLRLLLSGVFITQPVCNILQFTGYDGHVSWQVAAAAAAGVATFFPGTWWRLPTYWWRHMTTVQMIQVTGWRRLAVKQRHGADRTRSGIISFCCRLRMNILMSTTDGTSRSQVTRIDVFAVGNVSNQAPWRRRSRQRNQLAKIDRRTPVVVYVWRALFWLVSLVVTWRRRTDDGSVLRARHT